MSQKQTKKLRQMYRKDIRDEVTMMRQIIRRKPRWVPMWLWEIPFKIVFKNY